MSTSSLSEIGTDILKHLDLDVDLSLRLENFKMFDDDQDENIISGSCKTSTDNQVKVTDDFSDKDKHKKENTFKASEREKSLTASLNYVNNNTVHISSLNDFGNKFFYNTSRIYPQTNQYMNPTCQGQTGFINHNPYLYYPYSYNAGVGVSVNPQQSYPYILPFNSQLKINQFYSPVNYPQLNGNLQKNIHFISKSIPSYPIQDLPFFDEVISRLNEDIESFLKDYNGKLVFEKLIKKLTSYQRIKLWDSLVDKVELLCSNFTLYESLSKLLKLATEIPEQQRVIHNIHQNLDNLIKTEQGSNLIVYIILNYCSESVFRISSFIVTHIKQLINKHEGVEILNSFVMANVQNSASFKNDFINALYPHLIYIINNGMSSSLILEVLKNWKMTQINKIYEFMRNNVIAIINGKHSSLIIKWMIKNLEEKVR